MTKRILINKSKAQLRVARVDGQVLYDLEIEQDESSRKIDRICNGEVKSIEPSLNAAFISFGSERNGFLPLKEIAPVYYPDHLKNQIGRVNIKDVLFEGQKILVQVIKEEREQKGAALTTYISLAGCYLVLMPNNPRAGGISRRIEGEERDELKSLLHALTIPQEMGVIIRTAGMGKAIEELQWDLDVLVHLWKTIQEASKAHGAPYLIHQESDIAIRAIRDHLRPDISEILIDDKEIYEQVREYIEKARPAFVDRIQFYTEDVPLFSRFQLEKQIETAFQRKVRLLSGGEIVIDRTEALISIDVNSSRSTRGTDIEETATSTNIEAVHEIAKQLRIRDLGGLIVLDLIDMENESNRRKVEEALREALRNDRARVQVGHISRFGLLEMSRQRLRSALNEEMLITCPRCHGQGSIRNTRAEAVAIVHLIEEAALKKNIQEIRVQAPIDVTAYLMNELRESIDRVQKTQEVLVLIIPNPYIESPQYYIETVNKGGERGDTQLKPASYKLITSPAVNYEKEPEVEVSKAPVPAVKGISPTTAAPIVERKAIKKEGWLKRFIKNLFGKNKEPVKRTVRPPHHHYGRTRPQKAAPTSRRGADTRRAAPPPRRAPDSRERVPGTGGVPYNRQGSGGRHPSRPPQFRDRPTQSRRPPAFSKDQSKPVVSAETIISAPKTIAPVHEAPKKPVFMPKPIENESGFKQVETAKFVPVYDQVQKEAPKRSSEPAAWEKKPAKPAADEHFEMIETKKDE